MATCKVYEPETSNTAIKQKRTALYVDSGGEALYKVIDIQFVNYEWIHIASWRNDTDQTNEYEHTFQKAFSMTGGEELNAVWNFKDILKGLSFVIDYSISTITEDFVSPNTSNKMIIRVGPNSSVHLYMKRYTLKLIAWFQLNVGDKLWTVGRGDGAEAATFEATVEIDASDYLTTRNTLYGSASVNVPPASNIQAPTEIRQFQNCTEKCQNYLFGRRA